MTQAKTEREGTQASETPARSVLADTITCGLFGPFKAVQDIIGSGWLIIDKYESPLCSQFADQTAAEMTAKALNYYLY